MGLSPDTIIPGCRLWTNRFPSLSLHFSIFISRKEMKVTEHLPHNSYLICVMLLNYYPGDLSSCPLPAPGLVAEVCGPQCLLRQQTSHKQPETQTNSFDLVSGKEPRGGGTSQHPESSQPLSNPCLGLCISSFVFLGSEPNQVWAGLQEPREQRQTSGQGTWRQSSNSLPVRRFWILEPTCLH